MNVVHLIGYVSFDPEFRSLADDKKMAAFVLSTKNYRDKNGKMHYNSHRVVAFGRTAEKRYFSIKDKRLSRMIRKRMNFLNLCPVVGSEGAVATVQSAFDNLDPELYSKIEDEVEELKAEVASSHANMPALVEAIAHGAGYCDADHLNKRNLQRRQTTIWEYVDRDTGCRSKTVTYYVISPDKPNYCKAYEDHAYTYEIETKYVGAPDLGGKWVEAKDYDRALQDYQDNLQTASFYKPKNDSRCTTNRRFRQPSGGWDADGR